MSLQEARLRELTYFPSFKGVQPARLVLQIVATPALCVDEP